MDDQSTGYAIAATTKGKARCMELRFVLESVRIASRAVHHEDSWVLIVTDEDLAPALEELEAYRKENSNVVRHVVPRTAIYGGSIKAVCVYAAIIIWVYVVTRLSTFDQDWLAAGRMHAEQVTDGEYWRVITALTLHLDIGHLASNLVFGVVFGVLAGRILGGGVAWLAILFAGSLGNLMNAMIQQPEHSSIGASTAVFGALGILVAKALRPIVFREPSDPVSPLKRWSPLIGGLVLLGMTGVGGPRTDVAAHVTGFVAGLLVGWAGASAPGHWLSNWKLQALAGIVAIATVTLAWTIGLTG